MVERGHVWASLKAVLFSILLIIYYFVYMAPAVGQYDKKSTTKGCFKSEETRGFLPLQDKYSKSLSWAENLNFPPKTVNNLFKFSAQDSDLEYLFWQRKNSSVSSDLKPPLVITKIELENF